METVGPLGRPTEDIPPAIQSSVMDRPSSKVVVQLREIIDEKSATESRCCAEVDTDTKEVFSSLTAIPLMHLIERRSTLSFGSNEHVHCL